MNAPTIPNPTLIRPKLIRSNRGNLNRSGIVSSTTESTNGRISPGPVKRNFETVLPFVYVNFVIVSP